VAGFAEGTHCRPPKPSKIIGDSNTLRRQVIGKGGGLERRRWRGVSARGALRTATALGSGERDRATRRCGHDDRESAGQRRNPCRNDNGFYFGPTIEFVGDRYADFENSYRIDAYSLVGLRGGWSNDRWSVYADVVNILDKDYAANQSVRNAASVDDAILNPGAIDRGTPRANRATGSRARGYA
jgi:hypothetical protein